MNRFERILGKDRENQAGLDCPAHETNRETKTAAQFQPSQDEHWRAVLTNAFHLLYPGPDGSYKNPEPLRPLWVTLNWMREEGAGLVKVRRPDGSEHYKLVQGAMPADKWEKAKAGLAGQKDKLMWLFTLSVMGAVGEEEIEKHRQMTMELLEEAARQMRERDRLAAEQMKLDLMPGRPAAAV
ncbi:MAG: hypothetical protein ACPLQO_10490 [Desulfotomaculales bacterium]